MSLRTELEGIYSDELFADLYPKRGKPAEAPWRLALVTVLQFAEELSDREAATAVKARLDWKFALGLELGDTGFEHAVLSKFRPRLIEGNAEHRLLDALLEVCKAKGLIRKRGRARTDSTHVLAKVRALNRIGSCVESMRAALNAVATVSPEWLNMDSELLVDSRTDYAVTLHGPVQVNRRWQANTKGAYQIDDFTIDWGAKRVICPNNKQSVYWSERNDNNLIYVLFAKNDCFSCEQRSRCNRSEKNPRAIAFKPQQKHEALQGALRAQQTSDWHDLYAKRSGIEGTLSQGVRAFGLRLSRYFGLAKTHFQREAIAAAVNITRLAAWFDHKPRVTTRVSRFARLAA